jgi:hypothetical protein
VARKDIFHEKTTKLLGKIICGNGLKTENYKPLTENRNSTSSSKKS